MPGNSISEEVPVPPSFFGEIDGIKFHWSAISDPGKVRNTNEDGAMTSTGVYLLADGMGGHEGGEIASAAALSSMEALTVADYRKVLDQFSDFIISAVNTIDNIESKTGRQAGTTLTGVILASVRAKAHWLVINIGDSRTYLFRNNHLEQLTVDHSQVQELIDSGHLSIEQAKIDARRNVITRALGAGMEPEIEYWLYPIAQGDRLLICSDGLTSEIEDPLIGTILEGNPSSAEAVRNLLSAALEAGARDNVTIIVVDVAEIDPAVTYVQEDLEDDAVIHGELIFEQSGSGLQRIDD